jgi:hypothetical protein
MHYSRTPEEVRAQIAESFAQRDGRSIIAETRAARAQRGARMVSGTGSTRFQVRDLTRGGVSEDVEKRVQARVERITDSNLADCTLIGPDAGNELRRMVYGDVSDTNPLGAP